MVYSVFSGTVDQNFNLFCYNWRERKKRKTFTLLNALYSVHYYPHRLMYTALDLYLLKFPFGEHNFKYYMFCVCVFFRFRAIVKAMFCSGSKKYMFVKQCSSSNSSFFSLIRSFMTVHKNMFMHSVYPEMNSIFVERKNKLFCFSRLDIITSF